MTTPPIFVTLISPPKLWEIHEIHPFVHHFYPCDRYNLLLVLSIFPSPDFVQSDYV